LDAKAEQPGPLAPHPSPNVAPRVTTDRPFDGFRTATSERARELIAEATRRVANYEHHFGLRRRARKGRDQANFEATCAAVVAGLVHHELLQCAGAIAIPLDKSRLSCRSRYRPAALSKTLPHLLRIMASPELGILEMTLGWHDLKARPERERFRQTTIRAGRWIRQRIASMGLGFADIGHDSTAELIILRSPKRPRKGGILKADLVEYEDSALTVRLREEVRTINSWLAQADLGLAGPFPHIDTTPGTRRLKRVFNNATFNHGGRLSGGWWMNLPKAIRSEHLRIKGERVATLDYDALYVRLAYARVGITPPAGDIYTSIPGLEGHRRGAKVLLNSLLFDASGKRRSRKPMGTAELLPKGVPVGDLIGAIEQTHAPIAPLFGRGIGFELMNLESNIMVAVLLRLRSLGIVGLPVHDAVIVARSDVEAAASVMMMVAEEEAGHCLPVTMDAEEEDIVEEDDLD
jgi:hypothetical protein